MARTTPRNKVAGKAGDAGSLLSFFKKDGPMGNGGKTNAKTRSQLKTSQVKAERADPIIKSIDVKGKGRALEGLNGSSIDPVVISDDEEPQPRPKRQRFSPILSPPTLERQIRVGEPSCPSRSPTLRSCSRPPLPPPDPPDTTRRDPFPNLPGFKAPPDWPQIVNTAEDLDDLENDADGSVRVMDSDDEDAGDAGGQRGDREETINDVAEMEAFDPVVPESPKQSVDFPVDLTGPDLMEDMGMMWDEPLDEGMGMEDEGDDGISEIVRTPPPSRLKGARPITSINHFPDIPPSPSPPPEEVVKGPNAFSVLMSGHKEKEEWKDAEIDLKRDGKRFFGRRKAPFYKVLTGMPVAVDAFRYGAIPKVTAYLLTHAHSDHYTNLSKSWKEGPIYCSETTANLIIHMLGVEPHWVHGLPNNVPFEMPNTGGVTVIPIEANHCPGSSIFLFEGPQTVNAGDSTFRSPYVGSKRSFRYLHCGDFRACPKMVLHPAIAKAKIDTCYLDTTYLNPKYCFPPQPQVIEACAALARKTAIGVSELALSLDEIKPDIKHDAKFDIKPDVNAVREVLEEQSKAIMAGWLVKRESDDDFKPDLGLEGHVKTEDSEDVKPKLEADQLVDAKVKPKGRTLIVMGTYSIGKERIVKAVARALGSKIYCDPRKKGLLLCQTDPDLHAMLSSDPVESQVHLVPLSNIQLDRLQPYLARLHPHFDRVLGFRPTGWAYTPPAGTDMLPDVNQVIRRDQSRTFSEASLKPMRGSCKQYMMYGVPYSEHSSFFELTCFALSMPGPDVKMIATVNVGNEKSRAKMKKWFEKWAAEKAKRKEKNLPAIVDFRDENFW